MDTRRVNRISSFALIVLSAAALLTVLVGYTQAPQEDESALARLFQLSILALIPTLGVFLATADRTRLLPIARRLALPAFVVILAFAALYYGENYHVPAR